MEIKFLKRSILQRLFGISATAKPSNPDCWTYSSGKVMIDLTRAPELSKPGGALRLEGKQLPDRILLVNGEDGNYHAFRNRCQHMRRRLDPVPGTQTIQCCSVNKTTYAYDGKVLYGPAKNPVKAFEVQARNRELVITL